MVTLKNRPDWLPSGWKVQIKVKNDRKIKCYVNSKTCQKLYSKPAVLRHIKTESISEDNSVATEKTAKKSSEKQGTHLAVANLSQQWLPTGWTVEIRTRKSGAKKGTEYKCYIDPSGRNKLFSKPEVLRYLKSIQSNEGPSEKERRSTRHSSDNKSVNERTPEKSNVQPNVSQISKTRARRNLSSGIKEVLVENTLDEDLPSGWIKELRKRVLGDQVVRKDPLYFHPASGLVFRSKQEVLRYLETGEISRHAYRRRSGRPDGEELAVKKISSPSPVKSKKITSHGTRKEHTCQGVLSLVPETRGRRITRSSSKSEVAGTESCPVQSSLSTETANNNQEVPPSKSLVKVESTDENATSISEAVSRKIQSGDNKKNDVSVETTQPSASSREMLKGDKPDAVTMQGCSNAKSRTGKRKMKDQKLPSEPVRSSKRLAGVDAKVVFHSIPIEHALRGTSRKSIGTEPISRLKSSPDNLQEKPMSPDVYTNSLPASHESVHWALDVDAQPVLATKEQGLNSNSCMPRALQVVDLEEHSPPGFSKSSVNEAQTLNTAKSSDEPRGKVQESNIEQILEGQPDAVPQGKMVPVATSQPVQEEHSAKLGTGSVQSAPDISSPFRCKNVDLPRDPPILRGRPDAVTDSKSELSNTGRPAPEEQQASMARGTEQPTSEFSFPSPMWSDPCLEFAFKTLTGAIPLDDNLAIDDYIQHQLRTSK